MAGQLGFDEGGVLEALSKPLITHTIVREKTSKKGKKTTATTAMEISAAHILFFFLFYRLLTLFGNKASWEPGSVASGAIDKIKEETEDLAQWLNKKLGDPPQKRIGDAGQKVQDVVGGAGQSVQDAFKSFFNPRKDL